MSAWLASLRIARRDALRHRWRSLLIIALILVPVAGATAVDILYRTSTSAELERERVFGGADAVTGGSYYATAVPVEGQALPDPRSLSKAELEAALPPGSRVELSPYPINAVVLAPGRLTSASVLVTDLLGDPLFRAQAELVSGRAPSAPGEVAVSRPLAKKLDLLSGGDVRFGSTFRLRNGPEVTVTGVTRDPFCLDCSLIVAPTNSVLQDATKDAGTREGFEAPSDRFLVDLPADLDFSGTNPFAALSERGVYLEIRDNLSSYEYGFGDVTNSRDALTAAALVTLIAGLGLLEVVLLAGTAFAVGARRQTRDLGMLAAQGGSPRDLRWVVLAQGLLLGTIGTVGGLALGFGVMALSDPVWERLGNEVRVGLHFGIGEVVAVAVVGFLSGLAAAVVPALSASRRSTTDLLAARFPAPDAKSRRGPVIGAVLLAIGFGVAMFASLTIDNGWFGYGDLADFGAGDEDFSRGSVDVEVALVVLVGVFIAVAGLLLVTPTLLAGLARLAGRMPSTLRLATRDASRHRHRTGPATAAIAVAVGGAIAISCLIASEADEQGSEAARAVPEYVLGISVQGALAPDELTAATTAVRNALPGSQVLPMRYPIAQDADGCVGCEYPMQLRRPDGLYSESIAIGDADLAVLASGRVADRDVVSAALSSGRTVVFDTSLLDPDGTVGIYTGGSDADGNSAFVRVPAVAVDSDGDYFQMPGAVVPDQLVTERGWETTTDQVLISYPPQVRNQAALAATAAERLGFPVYTNAGEKDITRVVRVGLSSAAVLIGLLGVAMCVALSAAEGRPDLATLSAVGAAPSRRRRLAAAQALVLALLGTVLGIAFGFFFARAARPATGAVETIIPWGDLFPIVAAVPVLAVVIGLLGSLGRVQVTRRAD